MQASHIEIILTHDPAAPRTPPVTVKVRLGNHVLPAGQLSEADAKQIKEILDRVATPQTMLDETFKVRS